ncbi:MAG: hypothetical protein ABRQ39_15480 [Candidatus Eremiobacterota bacterium]
MITVLTICQGYFLTVPSMKDVIEEHDTSEEVKNLMEMTSLMVQISKFDPLKQEACIDTLKNFKSYILKELESDPFSLYS